MATGNRSPVKSGTARNDRSPATNSRPRGAYDKLRPLFTELADRRVPGRRRQQVRTRLVAGHLPVAQHIARRFSHRGQPVEDLTQVATVGLINAVDRFDPRRGTDFLSFAVPTIVGEVRRYFRDNTWSMRVPRRLKELHAAITAAAAELGQRDGQAPRPSDIAAHLGVPVETVLEGLQVGDAYAGLSLEDSMAGRPNATEAISKDESGLADVDNRGVLFPALSRLPTRERRIVFLRFYENLTQTQIADRVGLSQMQVSRLLSASLTQLRSLIHTPD